MDEVFEGYRPLTDVERDRMWEKVALGASAARDKEAGKGARSSRSRKRLFQAGLVCGVVAVSAAAISYASVTDQSGAECRGVDASGHSIQGTHIAQAAPFVEGQADAYVSTTVADALQMCGALWRDGFLRVGHEGIVAPEQSDGVIEGAPFPVPPLQACVGSEGFVVIIVGEGEAACTSNGYRAIR